MQRDEFIRLITNSVRNDLICRNEAFQCLALNFIGSGASFMSGRRLIANSKSFSTASCPAPVPPCLGYGTDVDTQTRLFPPKFQPSQLSHAI